MENKNICPYCKKPIITPITLDIYTGHKPHEMTFCSRRCADLYQMMVED